MMRKSFCGLPLLILTCICTIICVTPAQAGEINDNEARLVRAASGTFKHEGKTYRASAQYVDELREYLRQDDVDLTSEDVDSLISDMNANVAAGVQDGYLEEVGKTSVQEEDVLETDETGKEIAEQDAAGAEDAKDADAADSEPKQPHYTVEETPEETQIVATDGNVIFSAAPMIKTVGYHNRTPQSLGVMAILILTGIIGGTFMVIRHEKA